MVKTQARPASVERYTRAGRWFHAVTYVTVLMLLGTGWWLLAGREGQASWLAAATGIPDTTLHTDAGWFLAGLSALGVVLGARAIVGFIAETVRVDRGDLRWFLRWPVGVLTGRFARHEGRFDPGQRLANVVLVGLLAALIGSGVGLAVVSGGPSFVWLLQVHRWSTYLITPVLIGHIMIAAGFLPGYRGVARSMHIGGRVRIEVARRLWPGWLERQQARTGEELSDAGAERRDEGTESEHRSRVRINSALADELGLRGPAD
jgi:cytochrome b subunit of formate dehydrogenase